jgi:6-phosphogluconolactonase (cycloisomerase 2 family)
VFVCHQHSDTIVPFGFDSDAGTLDRIGRATALGAPVCLRFVA